MRSHVLAEAETRKLERERLADFLDGRQTEETLVA